MSTLLLLNGPNLARLGRRKPELYGTTTLEQIAARLRARAVEAGAELQAFQSNTEGELIDWIEQRFDAAGMIVNPGALMMTGYALRDTLEEFPGAVIEVHLSNVWAREPFRHHSVLSAVATGVVAGLGADGYDLALEALLRRVGQ
jgi:5-deoxy-5-amino-3-dehydroquinate dehydratase